MAPVSLTTPVTSKYAPLLYGAIWGMPGTYWPDSRGCKLDGRMVEDCTVMSGALTTILSNEAAFVASGPDSDVGKSVLGWSGTSWYGANGITPVVITAVNSPTSATISQPVPNAFASKGLVIGTDDTAGWIATVTDAVAYGQGGPQEARIFTPPLASCLATIATKSQSGYAQVPLPPITPGTALPVSLTWTSESTPPAGKHWLETIHDLPGASLICMRTDGALDSSNGPTCVIGGPVNGWGGSTGNFSDLHTMIEGLTLSGPYVDGYSGIIMRGIGQPRIGARGYSYMPLGQVPSGGPWPEFASGGPGTDQWTTGLELGSSGNNFLSSSQGVITVYGAEVAVTVSEHGDLFEVGSVFNGFGLVAVNPGAGTCHGVRVGMFKCEETNTPLAVLTSGYYGSAGPIGVEVGVMDLETYAYPVVQDTGGFLTGEARFGDNSAVNRYYSTPLVSSQSGYVLRSYNAKPGFVTLSGASAKPTSGNPWVNGLYTPVEVTFSTSGGTISGVTVNGGSELLPASCAWYRTQLAPGDTITPTFTGTLSMTVRVLSLWPSSLTRRAARSSTRRWRRSSTSSARRRRLACRG
jgi:hypothetical protein